MSEAVDILVRKEAIENVNKAIKSITELNSEIIKLSNSVANTPKQPAPEVPSAVISSQKEYSKFISETAANQKELQRQQNTLATSTAKLTNIDTQRNKELARVRLETQRVNKANKDAAILSSRYSTELQKLEVRTRKAREQFQNLLITQGKLAPETVKAQREFQNLNNKLNSAKRATGNFTDQVGNYPTALRPAIGALRNLVGAFGLVEGVKLAFNISKEAIELANQAKGVEFAFRSLGEVGQQAFDDVKTASRGLLSELEIKRSLVEFNLSLIHI